MQGLSPLRLGVRTQVDVVVARNRGLEMALAMGFSQLAATQIATVVSELARNIVSYARSGSITLIPLFAPVVGALSNSGGIQIIAQDDGPGISNVQRVLSGGYSTSRGMGLGLSGSKKLVDAFSVESMVGMGTTVTAVKYLQSP